MRFVQTARMTTSDHETPSDRLKQARERAGYRSARAASERFGWSYNSYAQHENGTRGISHAAAKYARAFKVRESWLMFGGASIADGRTQSSVLPFSLERDGPDSPATSLKAIADAIGSGKGREVWRVSDDSMVTAGYLPGDFILVDHQGPEAAEEGETLLIALNDLTIGDATNHLAHHAPPFAIILGGHAGSISAHRIDGDTVEIKGVVRASWRLSE